MNPAQSVDGFCIYQLRIVLRDISPLIWRRVRVRSDICIAALHDVLQIVMDWDDIHLHRFCIHGKDYGIARPGGMGFTDDPCQVRLCDFRLHRRERFLYEYDFIDGWVLEIRLEDQLKPNPAEHYPVCTAGRRAAPSEDCGGPRAYQTTLAWDRHHLPLEKLVRVADAVQRFLDTGDRSALGDPDTLRSALERLEAYYEFQPDHFDCRAINARFRQRAAGVGGEV
jgi:hypothetical protein